MELKDLMSETVNSRVKSGYLSYLRILTSLKNLCIWNSDQTPKKYKFGQIVIIGMKKLIKLLPPPMISLYIIKCGLANKNFHAMFLNTRNTGKEFSTNLFKFKLLIMNSKKSRLL